MKRLSDTIKITPCAHCGHKEIFAVHASIGSRKVTVLVGCNECREKDVLIFRSSELDDAQDDYGDEESVIVED